MKQYADKYDEFIDTFRVRDISVIRTDFHSQFYPAFENPRRFKDDSTELVEIKIDRNGLETLVEMTRESNQLLAHCRKIDSKIEEEKRLRETHPSLGDLYGKYLMMLELYR